MEKWAGGGHHIKIVISFLLCTFVLLNFPIIAYASQSITVDNTTLNFNQIIYVDGTNGSDSGDGSSLYPYKTITKAYSSLIVDNSCIYIVSGGSYSVPYGLESLLKGNLNVTYLVKQGLQGKVKFNLGGVGYNNDIQMFNNNNFINVNFVSVNSQFYYEVFYEGASVKLNFYNCVFDTGPQDPYFFPIVTGTTNPASLGEQINYNNCIFLTPNFSYSSNNYYCQGKFVNCAAISSKLTTQPYNLLSAKFNSNYDITSSGWQNTGTGNNPDGSIANMGVYGGPYNWASPPTAPNNVQANPLSAFQVSLTWDSIIGGNITGYYVYRNGIQIALVGGANNTSYIDSGLNPSTCYTYSIQSINSFNLTSPMSSKVSITTLAIQKPNLTYSLQDTTLSLTWNTSADNFYVMVNGQQVAQVTKNQYSFTVNHGQNYTCQVFGNIGSYVNISNTINVKIPYFSAPKSAPTDLIENISNAIMPFGGFLALVLSLKASPWIIKLARNVFWR